MDRSLRTSVGSLKSYKPRAIRATTLLLMIILSCGLIASLDVTISILPSSYADTSIDSRKRQLSDTPTTFLSSHRSPMLSSLPAVSIRSGPYTTTVLGTWTSLQTDGGSISSTPSKTQSSSLVTGPTANSHLDVNHTLSMVMPSTSPLANSTAPPPDGYLHIQIDGDFTGSDYFIGAYLSTLVALIYAGFWGVIDANVRRMEPFYQLARPKGAFAKDTLTFSYFSCNTFTAPFHAVRRRHWAVVCSSTAFLLASAILPPIAASTLIVGVLPSCSNLDQKLGKLIKYRTG